MAFHFTQIFWGLLLAIVDIGINGIDLLPDFIGYILVGLGCAGLDSASRRFSVASACCIFLALISLTEYFGAGDFAVAVGYIRLVLDCVMIWTLLGGVMDLAGSRERPDFARIVANRRTVYIGFIVCMLIAVRIGPSLPIFWFCAALTIFVLY